MNYIDKDADLVVNLFLKKHLKKRYPPVTSLSNPIFKKRGNSFDFKNIREYQMNDDLRKIDWKLYGRTSRYFIKEYFEEENLPIYILVDTSNSMTIHNELYLKSYIATFAYILLKLQYTINIITFKDNINNLLLSVKGTRKLHNLNNFIDNITFDGQTDIHRTLKLVHKKFKPSIVYLFSDLFCTTDYGSYMTNFKKSIIVHNMKSLTESIEDFGYYSVVDPETNETINITYDSIMKKRILDEELNFTKGFKKPKIKYVEFNEKLEKSSFYISLLESLYE